MSEATKTEVTLLGYKRDRSMIIIHFFGLRWIRFGSVFTKLKFLDTTLYRRIKGQRQVFGIPAIGFNQ